MINISLKVDGAYILFLSIPNDDVRRLSIHPFKWIKAVMFCICGTRGDLSEMLDGVLVPVDYSRTNLADGPADDSDIMLYYNPLGKNSYSK